MNEEQRAELLASSINAFNMGVSTRVKDTSDLVAEILFEAKQFTIADFEAHERNAGNGGWLDIRKAAREELIRHLERTFGGL